MALFTETPGDFFGNTCASIATCTAEASGGTPWLTLGASGLPSSDFQWRANGVLSDDVAFFPTIGQSIPLGSFGMAMDVLYNNTGYKIGPTPMTQFECQVNGLTNCAGGINPDVYGSGTVKGGSGLTNGWAATSDFRLTMTAASLNHQCLP